ncbi:hypothetical protein T484DRAFT_1756811 [Baffinella frigidus]|nr:hypothetical protein T484DRAFT_1756811 [Cryptophyta sp. CCMP2293]
MSDEPPRTYGNLRYGDGRYAEVQCQTELNNAIDETLELGSLYAQGKLTLEKWRSDVKIDLDRLHKEQALETDQALKAASGSGAMGGSAAAPVAAPAPPSSAMAVQAAPAATFVVVRSETAATPQTANDAARTSSPTAPLESRVLDFSPMHDTDSD